MLLGTLGRMVVSKDGKYLLVISGKTSVKIFDLSTEEEISEFPTYQGRFSLIFIEFSRQYSNSGIT